MGQNLASKAATARWGRLLSGFTCALLTLWALGPDAAFAEGGRFDGYEIRVIRPRFMNKTGRLELAGETAVIMNQPFIYTFLASGLLDYHFSEAWALEIDGAYGQSIDKGDKTLLKKDFGINTMILRTQYIAALGILWTPVYGKTQLSNGQVLYFDSFVTAQAGLTGINYTYDNCNGPTTEHPELAPKPAPQVKAYPSGALGLGQKFFVSEDFGVRWEVRDYAFMANNADGSCSAAAPDSGTSLKFNIILQIGVSTFF